MAKGFFTQSAVILLDSPVDIDRVATALGGFQLVHGREEATAWSGQIGDYLRHIGVPRHPSLTVALRPEVNGFALVDVVPTPWPDIHDDAADPVTFVAASMGWYGPFACTGSLDRAARASGDAAMVEVAERHRAHAIVRSSYLLGSEGVELPEQPPDYDAVVEIAELTRIALAVASLPETMAYFNPNGERLVGTAWVRACIDHYRARGAVPIPLYSQVRAIGVPDAPEWTLFDTVGLGQLDAPDQEVAIHTGQFDFQDVASLLYFAAKHLVGGGDVSEGERMNGPGDTTWYARWCEVGGAPPPRRVVRWFPDDGSEPPPRLLVA
jgi:hypothetical protein